MDIGKFIAMIFIVLIHVLQRSLIGFTGKDGWGSIYFLMLGVPPFFFFSGMSYRLKKPLSPLGFLYDIVRRAFLYFVPFVWFIALRVWLYNQWPDFSKGWDELMLYPISGLWVCWILLWISLVVDIGLFISYICPKFKVAIVSLALVIGYVVLMIYRNRGIIETNHTIGYDYFMVYAPIFLVGYICGPYILKIKNIFIYIACLIVGSVALIPIAINNHEIIGVNFLEKSQWMMYLAALCSVLVYFGLINLVKKLKFSYVIAFLGQFTMEMYFLHLMLLKNWKTMHLGNNWVVFWVTVGLFLLCYVNTFGVILVTYYVPFLHFAMFGKHYSRYKFEDRIFGFVRDYCYSNGNIKKPLKVF